MDEAKKDSEIPVSRFAEMGFLSDVIAMYPQDFRATFPDWVKLYFEVNKVAQELLPQLAGQTDTRDARRILAMGVFYRALIIYQSLFLLVERGFDLEPKILLRTLSEAAIVSGAIRNDPGFARKFIKSSKDSQRRLLKKTIQAQTERENKGFRLFLDSIKISEIQTKLSELESERTTGKASGEWVDEMKMNEIADTADRNQLYWQHVAYFSSATHISPFSMEEFLATDSGGKIKAFKMGPNGDDALSSIRESMHLLLRICADLNSVFTVTSSPTTVKLLERLQNLVEAAEGGNFE